MPSFFTKPAKTGISLSWSIPARKTCPSHGARPDTPLSICHDCYSYERGMYSFNVVKNAQEYRYKLSKSDDFAAILRYEFGRLRKRPKHFRIHDSGDFYNMQYFRDWIECAQANPDIHFYFYTKEIALMLDFQLIWQDMDNFTPIFSYGGTQDHLIKPDIHRHSFPFPSLEHLESCGYVNATANDLNALDPNNHRIGLIAH